MSKITVKCGKGNLHLKKSKSLVGLKTNQSVETKDQEFVNEEILSNLGGFNVVSLNTEHQDVDTKLDEVRQEDVVEVGTHVYFAEGSNKPVIATGEIFIEFRDGVSKEEQDVVLDEYKLEIAERRNKRRIIAKVTPQSPNPLKVASALQQISLIEIAEPDIDIPMDEYFLAPQDHLIPHQWHLKNSGNIPDISYKLKKGADAKVVDAWNRLKSTGDKDIVVAVIDNGFDTSHPDLSAKIFRPFDIRSRTSNLPQNKGYTHGTPCASVAIASNNGNGIVGAAPSARFMPINGTSFDIRDTEKMFDYCAKKGADIISCSWGTTDSRFQLNSLKEEAIAKAAREGRGGKGCVILFAVGNDNLDYVNFYAAHPDVIAVAASTSQDKHAYYSNRGKEVSVCAPSNGDWPIIAARAWWDQGWSDEVGNFKYWTDGRSRGSQYKHFGGTSSSTPLVAGVCALILSANPDLTARQVKQILQKTADKIGPSWEYSNGHSMKYGYGRINADKAVAEALRMKESIAPPVIEVDEPVTSGRGLFHFDVRKQEPKGWGVQIGAFYEYGNVLIQVEKLQKKFGEKIIVSINELNGKTVYKVVVGAFANKSDALSLKTRIRAGGYPSAFQRNLKDLA